MQKHLVYIATDANRLYLEVDYCQDINVKYFELLAQLSSCFLSPSPKLSRIILVEEYPTFEAAVKRKAELNMYTRMMKERVIRRNNPNWLSLVAIPTNTNKKAAVYA